MLIPSGRLIKTFISCDKLTCCFRLEYVRYLWIDRALMNALVSIEEISKDKECLSRTIELFRFFLEDIKLYTSCFSNSITWHMGTPARKFSRI